MKLPSPIRSMSLISGCILGAVVACPPAAASGKATDSEKAPVVYVVPLEGQMGTDIHEQNIDDVIEDIKSQASLPDIVVLKIHSADTGTNYHLPSIDPKEFGMIELEAYRKIVRDLHNELPDSIRQVVWVEDSVGLASLLALSWCEMYMAPDARLYGLYNVFQVAQGWGDADVREKMEEAWEGIGRGFLEMGCHGEAARELGGAMMDPSKKLSADFKGRKVLWRPDTSGTWVIDGNDEGVANFEAVEAEDTLLCDGIAESIDDLMFLMGYREYQLNDSGEELVNEYHERWRSTYEKSLEMLADMEAGRLVGRTQLQQLAAQKQVWDRILANMRRFGAVERRLDREFGIDIINVQLLLDQLQDQIRQLRDSDRGGGGRGRGGGGISGGGKGRN